MNPSILRHTILQRLIQFSAALTIIVGFLVIYGWHTHNLALIGIQPSWPPMQYNSAICFILSGLGILSYGWSRWLLRLCSLSLLLISICTLVEYILHINLGIDLLFHNNPYTIAWTSSPGRMSVISALSFSLIGSCLLFLRSKRALPGKILLCGLFGSVIISMSLISLASYISLSAFDYESKFFIPMAFHSASIFLLLALCVIRISWNKIPEANLSRTSWLTSLSAGIGIMMTLGLYQASLSMNQLFISEILEIQAENTREKLELVIDAYVDALTSMALRLQFDEKVDINNWEVDAQEYLRNLPKLQLLAYFQPQDQVAWIVPNHNNRYQDGILTEINRLIHRVSTELEKVSTFLLSNPIDKKAYALAIIVHVGDKPPYKGFLCAIIHPQQIFSETLRIISSFNQVLEVTDNDHTILLSPDEKSKQFGILASRSFDIPFLDIHWFGKISYILNPEVDKHRVVLLLTWITGLLFTFFSLLSGYLAQQSWKMTQELNQTTYLLMKNQEELKEAKELAEAASQAKSGFLANMTHEIRTPMTTILGYTKILENMKLPPSQQKQYLEVISKSGNHLLSIINNILDISRIDVGKLKLKKTLCSLEEIITKLAFSVKEGAQRKGLLLQILWETSIPKLIYTDPKYLLKVLTHLCNNSIKFTHSGSITIHISMKNIEESSQIPLIQFEIRDTGIGIDSNVKTKLFEAFFQGEASNSKRYGGIGVGLAISKNLVEMLGGKIWCKDTSDAGSHFIFTIDPGPWQGPLIRPASLELYPSQPGPNSN